MKAIKLLFFIIVLLASTKAVCQDYTFKNYDWEEKPGPVVIPKQYNADDEVVLERNIRIEIIAYNKQAKQFFLLHDRLLVNSDIAIERNNRVYVSFNDDEKIVVTKVRVILPDGKMVLLNEKDIKEEIDEEKGLHYHYFALNGLEKGAVIEKIVVKEQLPDLDGSTYRLQAEHPVCKLDFRLVYPSHLSFKTRSLNGTPEPVLTRDTISHTAMLQITDKEIPSLRDDEEQSNWNAMVRTFRYKLDENRFNGSRNMFSFKAFATNAFDRFNVTPDKKQARAIKDFCSTIPKSSDLQAQIWSIENKIKRSIVYNDYYPTKGTVSEILRTKQANQTDILSLYLAALKEFNIENEVVFTSDRFKTPFMDDFESYENINDLLIYFPAIKKFLAPTELEYRIPLIPSRLAATKGLFVRKRMFGGVEMGVGEVGFIPIAGIETTHDTLDIVVDFRKDLSNPQISETISFGGYSGISFQPLKDFASAEDYNKILKSLAENYAAVKKDYKKLTAENDGLDNVGKKSFVLHMDFDGNEMVKKAGDTYLFSVGQTIGRQMELYQERKRVLPVEIAYPHAYTRKIKILLPPGVSVTNVEKLVMDYKTVVGGSTDAHFTSRYNYTKNELNIENEEDYQKVQYPLDAFEQYRSVINAAADFNKIVLVINKV